MINVNAGKIITDIQSGKSAFIMSHPAGTKNILNGKRRQCNSGQGNSDIRKQSFNAFNFRFGRRVNHHQVFGDALIRYFSLQLEIKYGILIVKRKLLFCRPINNILQLFFRYAGNF